MLILDLVTERNKSIRDAGGFFKLTGRFPILNLYKLMKEVDKKSGGNSSLSRLQRPQCL